MMKETELAIEYAKTLERIDGYKRCWDIARRRFGHRVFFYAPTIKHYETEEFQQRCGKYYFMPVSITGDTCELNCEHCGRKILKSMRPTTTPEELFAYAKEIADQGCRGILVSGGSDARGVVPIRPFLKTLARIKERFEFRIVVHLGILDEDTAREIKETEAIDGAMIDIVGSDDTLRQIYHMSHVTTSDFENSLRLLYKYRINTIPHVVIGLHYGRIVGEYHALEIISRYKVSSLVLVGLFPQSGTPMHGVIPPSPEEMGEVFKEARTIFPDTPILLGCARPMGRHKLKTDILALKAGLNGIAYPAEGIVEFARKIGLVPRFSEMCCSLLYQDLEREEAKDRG